MGKNVKGGKNRKRGKNHNEETQVRVVLNIAKEGQQYARVTKMLGNCRLLAKCYNDKGVGKDRLCIIPGKFRKRVYINMGDIILISIRSFQDDKVDVIYKYPAPEAKKLIRKGLIPDEGADGKFKRDNETTPFGVGIEFVGQGDDDEDEDDVVKKKVKPVTRRDDNYISEDMMPPSDSDSEDEAEGNKPEKKVTFGKSKGFNDFDFDEEEEIDLEDL